MALSLSTPPMSSQRKACLQKQLRKTKLCAYHMKGACQFGDECAFAHTPEELERVPDLTKTRLCKAFQAGGCANKDCTFAHGESELRSTAMFYKKTLCYWNSKGQCRSGAKCRFAHSLDELNPTAGPASLVSTSDGSSLNSGNNSECGSSMRSGSAQRDTEPLSPLIPGSQSPGSKRSATDSRKVMNIGGRQQERRHQNERQQKAASSSPVRRKTTEQQAIPMPKFESGLGEPMKILYNSSSHGGHVDTTSLAALNLLGAAPAATPAAPAASAAAANPTSYSVQEQLLAEQLLQQALLQRRSLSEAFGSVGADDASMCSQQQHLLKQQNQPNNVGNMEATLSALKENIQALTAQWSHLQQAMHPQQPQSHSPSRRQQPSQQPNLLPPTNNRQPQVLDQRQQLVDQLLHEAATAAAAGGRGPSGPLPVGPVAGAAPYSLAEGGNNNVAMPWPEQLAPLFPDYGEQKPSSNFGDRPLAAAPMKVPPPPGLGDNLSGQYPQQLYSNEDGSVGRSAAHMAMRPQSKMVPATLELTADNLLGWGAVPREGFNTNGPSVLGA